MTSLFDKIITARGLDSKTKADFLLPNYLSLHDPFLLPDMKKAINRLITAYKKQEKIVIYGDYDIDGLTSTAILIDAFKSFGYKNVKSFIPSRFVEGYGLSTNAIETLASEGIQLIITVDCGSSSEREIKLAKKLNIDVIITDHHNTENIINEAIAVVNPKRADSKYPFKNLASVGIVFKLIQAMQKKLNGLPDGQEKWLLDLVSLGTVCDIVPLFNENRVLVFYGLRVMKKTKRLGLKALLAISGTNQKDINTRIFSHVIGPRMNAAGRLETAKHSLDMLTVDEPMLALKKAEYLDSLNKTRRLDQEKIFKQAIIQAEKYMKDNVLVVSGKDWNHGIVGIVASKLLEKYKKPTFVLEEIGDESKGSARSFGDFSVVNAINYCKNLITKGGGHELAAGIVLPTKNIDNFRAKINKYYKKLKLNNQRDLLLPKADAIAELSEITEELVDQIKQLEPFGIGNLQPVLKSENLLVTDIRKLGVENQHIKICLQDDSGKNMQFIAFNAPDYFFVESGIRISVWYHPEINEWQGKKTVEGRLLHLEFVE